MLCQLSYAPRRFERTQKPVYPGAGPARFPGMRPPSQRRALGALFLVLASAFAGVAAAAGAADSNAAGRWVIAIAAGVIALWLLGLAVRAFRTR